MMFQLPLRSDHPVLVMLVAVGVAMFASPAHAQQQRRTSPPTRSAASPRNPHGSNLRETCATCHAPDSWVPARVASTWAHAPQRFPLTGAHADATCSSCHRSLEFQKVSASCASCHTDVHKGELGNSCARCHTTRSFVDRGRAVAAHQTTRFPLRGAHAVATCESCHSAAAPGQMQFAARTTTCASCHMPTFRATTAPNHSAVGFSTDCTSCHSLATWTGARFDHEKTQFALTGAHRAATCASCHADNTFAGKPAACLSCHQEQFTSATSPRHTGFPTTCASCHTTTMWEGATFDHQTQTQFALTGKHVEASCESCHASNVYKGLPSACLSCHQPDLARTAKPPHQAAGFAGTCESCHNTSTWIGAPYDHAATRFALTGAHRAISCTGCHADGVFVGKALTCVSCHASAAAATTNPDHAAARFATTCESCHNTTAWGGAKFDHATTRFGLTGRHASATCLACHADRVYAGKATTCVSCHQGDYDRVTTPNHRQLGFPVDCESCHSTVQWRGAAFDHAATQFPLTGAHQATDCQSCHASGVFKGTPTSCASCHQSQWESTTLPHHGPAGFGMNCGSCHTTATWRGPPTFDHATTRFQLTGQHLYATCLRCHSDRVYRDKPSTCVACHLPQYDASTQPNHRASGIASTCESCHGTLAWRPASFDHAATGFPLMGAHRAVDCASCHQGGVFKGTPLQCVGCHQASFDATKNPDHRAMGFPATCASCHNDNAWSPASFDHGTTRFPLTGAHVAATCASCHSDGVFRGKATSCSSCHQSDFDQTASPNHRAAGFPTTCESCHTTTRWLGATFNHDPWFPIYTGKHRGKWSSCVDCHTNSASYAQFTCLTCHEHRQSAMDDKHKERSGYSYNSNACYGCHPRGDD